jgi:hypothetical protein
MKFVTDGVIKILCRAQYVIQIMARITFCIGAGCGYEGIKWLDMKMD